MVGVSNKESYQGMIRDLLEDGELIEYEGAGGSNNRWVIGFEDENVIVVLEADNADPFMNLEKLYSVVKRQGGARRTMRLIILAADKWGVSLELDVAPFTYSLVSGNAENKQVMNVESLERFYETFGFQKNEMDGIIYFHRIVS